MRLFIHSCKWHRENTEKTMSKLTMIVAFAGVIAPAASLSASGTYYNLGASRSPTGVSADGTLVAGTTTTGQPYFIWQLSNPGVTTLIGGVTAGNGVGGTAKVSNDGDKISGTIAGFVSAPPIPPTVVHQMAVYDVSDAAWTGVGGIGWFSGTETASGWAISGDGSTLAGLGWSPNQTNAYACVSVNGAAPTALPWLVPGRSTRANGCNVDGSVIVGWQDNPFGFRQAAVWVNGIGQRIWRTYPKQPCGEAQACSADGNWVVGIGNANTNSQAWRWSQSTGVQLLGELNPADGWNALALGISADGNVIVGTERFSQPGFVPLGWIWTSTGGMQNLTDYVMANGVTLPAGLTLSSPLNVSGDGRTFVGIASNNQGFVVRIDPPANAPTGCEGDADSDGAVDVNDLLGVILAWGECTSPCPGDFNDDGQVDVSDLLTVIIEWGACP
jgi:hypothetical protein